MPLNNVLPPKPIYTRMFLKLSSSFFCEVQAGTQILSYARHDDTCLSLHIFLPSWEAYRNGLSWKRETLYLSDFDKQWLYFVVDKLQGLYDVTGIVSSYNVCLLYV